jgi:ubiquinone/menaquinone biosynthesis C-methylase UbiE
MAEKRDRWAQWLFEGRQGSADEEAYRRTLESLWPVRERVLDNAHLGVGEVLLDVGAGDGLIAFGALDRVGPEGRVIFSDVSQELLDVCRQGADGDARAEFVVAHAEDLAPVADESVDVVTTRSVIIYVDRDAKERAFREFFRVLRLGGRLSMFEPINVFGCAERRREFFGLETGPVADLAERVKTAYDGRAPGEKTLIDFDERDLLGWAEAAGFAEVTLDYEARIIHGAAFAWEKDDDAPPWETFLNMSGNPLAPTLAEVLDEALTPAERERFIAHLRPAYEARKGTSRMACAYLRAAKR